MLYHSAKLLEPPSQVRTALSVLSRSINKLNFDAGQGPPAAAQPLSLSSMDLSQVAAPTVSSISASGPQKGIFLAVPPGTKPVPARFVHYTPNVPAVMVAGTGQPPAPAPVASHGPLPLAALANRKTIAKDILRALVGSAPEPHTGKRKRGHGRVASRSSPPPSHVAAQPEESRSQAGPSRGASSDAPREDEVADIEIQSFAVVQEALQAPTLDLEWRTVEPPTPGLFTAARDANAHPTIEEVESDATIAPMALDVDDLPEATGKPNEPPLFWRDSNSPDDVDEPPNRSFRSATSAAESEADVDALLLRSPSPDEPPHRPAIPPVPGASAQPPVPPVKNILPPPAPKSLVPAQQLSDTALAVRRLRHAWPADKPDLSIVELPRLPADWLPREKEGTRNVHDI
ncbi:hypothetical protein EXIGLDRAFT_24276 [Exidia glandulosa HHB12029]|uniref:Uncharacterized protein n=1 Tax=Exidia glandulosa HHB12029 TaxID=1314781 RepID=A0A165R1R7_EXIGL|nr:hypothetical protein EXIGLDRAFT_24276 [Exidia glandulosa HHB12029]